MTTKTIRWTCTAGASWEWLSGAANPPPLPSFPTQGDPTRTGTVMLPPNPDFWYSCIELILQGITTGNAFFRYYQDTNGNDVVQACTVAQGHWTSTGLVGTSSSTDPNGGFSLIAQLA